ncbi:hypothetical protein RHMOL_Rhmol09G0201700 [Rhododendron molle]|uniref:Uncharacterized protein n=1 Tax=Rhododendron molle TaxID=49168 RepID=A0ACC0MFD6_RHOML|nr:hypothetical protein RHMOL_Rhmol09G0201700 [Rhododendron molle]
MGVFEIPERYLLGRWRLDAKDCELEKEKTRVDENDPKLQKAARFRIICPKMVKLATRSCEVQEAYEFVEETVEYMCAKVANILLGAEEEGCTDAESEELEKVDPQFARVKGLKKKSGLKIKGTRRLKPWHERGRKLLHNLLHALVSLMSFRLVLSGGKGWESEEIRAVILLKNPGGTGTGFWVYQY